MSTQWSVWFVVTLALLSANLPFLSRRWLGVWPSKTGKRLGGRLLELGFFYVLTGLIGVGLERRLGQMAPQPWEFYAITAAFFVTLSFPGFVVCYLMARRSSTSEA